jgi:DeoR/GlpR family transcriptional regulator of sugar metabolism
VYQEERLERIVEYINKHKRISVEEICSIYEVSRDTARRDLVKLEEQKRIIRTHGGALLSTIQKDAMSYRERLLYVIDEKRAIGKIAASLIKNGDKIILDSSTTVQACAEFIDAENCTVITNSINQAEILSTKMGINIHLLGGDLNKEQLFLYGPQVIAALSQYRVKKAFIGVVGITLKGLTTSVEDDGHVVRKMIEQADQVIVLADHTKFGHNGYFRYAELSVIDIIITDQAPTEDFMEVFEKHKIEVIYTKTTERCENYEINCD